MSEQDDTIHGCGKVFDEGVAKGVYTDAKGIVVVTFHSSEDGGYISMLKSAPGLSAFGATPEESLKEFCTMLPVVVESGLQMSAVSYPFYTRNPST